MSAGTISLTNNSATVTGTGTAFTTDLKANDFIVVIVGGVTYTLGVKAIASATSLTLITPYNGPTATGNAWNAVPNATLVGITAQVAADVAKAIRGLNLDKANWQQVFSGTGTVTVTLPDGSTYTGPAWSSITNSLAGKADLTSGAVAISQGGTGANTKDAARTALGAAPTASPVFSGTSTFAGITATIVTANQGSFSNNYGECINLFPIADNLPAFIRGKLYDGTLHWYLGKGSSSTRDLAWSNYLGPNSFNLLNSGASTIVCASSTYTFQTNGTANGTNWNSTSDGRIKKDKTKLTNVMDVINGLTGYSYQKKINALNDLPEFVEDTGVLAEDLLKVIPSAVSDIGDGFDVYGNPIKDVLTANYSAIIPFLIEACKEQHARIEALEQKLLQTETEQTS
ncbi:tail fiber domain-containing protein [Rahnella victoriana]|uniref:tail fiber domain-containing protein n=1 Tax=Rahnella victoriana TaxID=1510570 RepID=UPI001E33AFD3|nr:tail fiber domain-containing protein [Rahnella victoriana]UHM89868.1 tail fiber domain-containing protein [Rahnella victoriana]